MDQINAVVMAPDQTLWVAGSTSSRNLPLSEGSTQKAVWLLLERPGMVQRTMFHAAKKHGKKHAKKHAKSHKR